MASIEEAAHEREERSFVGRERELAAFRPWLASETPEILSVAGPGGVGKTTLLAAFARIAKESGRQVVLIDGRTVLPTREEFLGALGQETLDEALADLSATRPLLLIDAFEALADLTRFLHDELLPALDARVRLVVAGRLPLASAWRRERWPIIVRPLLLERLGLDESREYLVRRGISDPALVDEILSSCGGWPLALSLAADLVEQLGLRRLEPVPEWRLAMRGLVDQLLDEAGDSALPALLEAGSVVRQFDQATLLALAGEPAGGEAFTALCRLSLVHPTDRGLALHEDVRRLVADDLRWRRPERHAELRLRALDHLRERTRRASPPERERLLTERLFLWEHEVVSSILFPGDEPGEVWVEPMRSDARDELISLNRRWQLEVRPAIQPEARSAPWDAEAHFSWFARLIADPAARVRIARDRAGEAVGYDVVLPVCEATLALAMEHEVIAGTLDPYLALEGAPALQAGPEQANLVFLAHLGLGGPLAQATRAALQRDLLSVLARGGVCLCSLDLDDYRQVGSALGFREVPRSQVRFRGADYQGFALDLRGIGPELWFHCLLTGSAVPTGPGELERELKELLDAWGDDRRLAGSPLAALVSPRNADTAAALRRAIEEALARALTAAGPAQELELRAVELGYLERTMSRERAAEELNVSRATFYRLLRRGVGQLAAAFPDAAQD